MFCPKCGNADQMPESYCRKCGTFLHDFGKSVKKRTTPQQHLKVNSVLNLMTAIVSLTLAISLYTIFLNKEGTHPIIYITAGFLLAICGWQVQTFWRTLLLKKQLKRLPKNFEANTETESITPEFEKSTQTDKLLEQASYNNQIPLSVAENTTKHLDKIPRE